MIDLPLKAEVYCTDGIAGRSTHLIGNTVSHQLTHLVVKSYRPPFHEYLVPVDQVDETTPDRIRLKCARDDFNKMEPFEVEENLRAELPGYIVWDSVYPADPMTNMQPVETYISVKRQNIPLHEVALRRGAKVEATDGTVGLVDELLIDSNNKQVTHLVLLERHIFTKREITIPASQIDRIDEDTVYLKLDRQSVEMLPTTPKQRWPEYEKDTQIERKIKMDKILVVVFDNEKKAYEGSMALQELQNEGSINLYAKVVIARDASGKVAVKQQDDMGPVGTAVGLLIGSLIGLLGGPVGLAIGGPVGLAIGGSVGIAIGAGVGTYGGLLYDLAHLGVGQDFLSEVEKSLLPGKAAVVAEVWEEWTLPVDDRMEALGGFVLRRTRRDVVDAQIERDAMGLQVDLMELEAELDQATGEAKARLQAKVDAAKARLQAKQDDIQARIEASGKEAEAKINSLHEQADKARGERKAKLDKRIAELKADQKRRSEQLKQAWEHAKEALKD